jgi:hypothetical protein
VVTGPLPVRLLHAAFAPTWRALAATTAALAILAAAIGGVLALSGQHPGTRADDRPAAKAAGSDATATTGGSDTSVPCYDDDCDIPSSTAEVLEDDALSTMFPDEWRHVTCSLVTDRWPGVRGFTCDQPAPGVTSGESFLFPTTSSLLSAIADRAGTFGYTTDGTDEDCYSEPPAAGFAYDEEDGFAVLCGTAEDGTAEVWSAESYDADDNELLILHGADGDVAALWRYRDSL